MMHLPQGTYGEELQQKDVLQIDTSVRFPGSIQTKHGQQSCISMAIKACRQDVGNAKVPLLIWAGCLYFRL